MNAISRHTPTNHYYAAGEHSDARTELARHHFDLRVHALVMLFTAVAAGYCAITVLNFNDSLVSGNALGAMAAPDLLSAGAVAIFSALSAFCLWEAHRGWKKAAITSALNESRAVIARRPVGQSLVAAE